MKKFTSLAKYLVGFFILGFAFLSMTSAVRASQAEIIKFRSGSGTTRFIAGPKYERFKDVLPTSEIVRARAGSYASVVATPNPGWLKSLYDDPEARWISVSSMGYSDGSTAIYATDFYITQNIESAKLKIAYSVDNHLGDWINDGLYLNGYQVPCAVSMGEYTQRYVAECEDVKDFLRLGTNTIYFYNVNVSNASGIMFSGEVSINEPEEVEEVVDELGEEAPRVLVVETEPDDEIEILPESGMEIFVYGLIAITGLSGFYIFQKSKLT